MRDYGKVITPKDKAEDCIEKAELALLEEKVCSLQKKQASLEEQMTRLEKIAFSYLSTLQRVAEEISSLKKWRDHKIRR